MYNKFIIYAQFIFCIFIFYSQNLSSQVVDPRFDKFLIVNEWMGTISVRVNWTKDLIGTATVTGTVNIKKSFNQELNYSWGAFTPDESHPWNWEVEYTIEYDHSYVEDEICHHTGNGNGKFWAAIFINPINYTYFLAFDDPGVPVKVSCPDDTYESTANIVYGSELDHMKLDLDTLLLKGSISFTDTEAREKNKEVFDSYKDSIVNRLNRNLDILDSFHIPVPEIEEEENNTSDETGEANYVVTWELTPKRDNSQITLHEVDKDWYPSENGTISTYVEWNPEVQPVAVRFTLFDITNEKGYCLNSREEQETMDITFDSAWSTENHFELDSVEGKPNSMTATLRSLNLTGRQEVRLKSYDYGGWAKLKVELMFENTWVPSENFPYTTVPFDQDEDKIADKWEEDNEVSGLSPDSDMDKLPVSNEIGDAITLYEEYRGFFVLDPDKKHIRTNPNKRELFVIDEDELFSVPAWKNASRLMSYRLDNSMVKGGADGQDSRIVDFNQGYAAGVHKYSVRLKKSSEIREHNDKVTLGECFPETSIGKPPKYWDSTVVYVEAINYFSDRAIRKLERENYATDEELKQATGLTREQFNRIHETINNASVVSTIKEFFVNRTVLHEVGHSCAVDHHDPVESGFIWCPMKYGDDMDDFTYIRIYLTDVLEFIRTSEEGEVIISFASLDFCGEFNCLNKIHVRDD